MTRFTLLLHYRSNAAEPRICDRLRLPFILPNRRGRGQWHRRLEPIRDDYFKWFGIPYPQSGESLQAMERQLDQARSESKGRNPFLELLPSLSRAHFILARTDREIAALRCIEAIRMYAASHDSKLPATLAEITEVPLPSDPVTGKPFVYESHGDTATMTGVIPDQESPDYVRYELTTK